MRKLHPKTLLLFAILLLANQTQGQHKNDFEAGVFNIGFGGLIGGIGAIINKKPNEKTGKVFLKGVCQGALGGYLLFESKRLVGKFSDTGNYSYVWPSKFVNAAGTSIIENAAANRNFWEQWHINIGFNRFEFYIQNKFKMTYRVMPFALGNVIYGFTQGKLDVNESIKIGSFVFKTNFINSSLLNNPFGVTLTNSILIRKKESLPHELIHVYQYESFSSLNPFLDKPLYNLNNNSKWVRLYHKIFYTDFNYLTFGNLYNLNKDHNTNFFENEARFYERN